jgi:signal transduction histidine kinase
VLHDFLVTNRTLLIDRCRAASASRNEQKSVELRVTHGIPVFLDQLVETLALEHSSRPTSLAADPSQLAIAAVASVYGCNLLHRGFTLEGVVRDYGDVCQAVTNLACETGAIIDVAEFRTFNRCLDEAIAGAVTGYGLQTAAAQAEDGAKTVNLKLGQLAHELRNYLHVATHAFRAIKTGQVATVGATAAVLDRSLAGMGSLIDRALTEVRVNVRLPAQLRNLPLFSFIAEVQSAAALDPLANHCRLTVAPIDADLSVFGDAEMLSIAVRNLLQNAFKFTKPHTDVSLSARESGDRILIDITDHCGGLPPGSAERLLLPFVQIGSDRSGLGLGLDICRRNVEANGGSLRVRDIPGSGCVFTIDLPRLMNEPRNERVLSV